MDNIYKWILKTEGRDVPCNIFNTIILQERSGPQKAARLACSPKAASPIATVRDEALG